MSESSIKVHPSRPSALFATTRARRAEIARLRRLGREGLPPDIDRETFLRRVRAVVDDLVGLIEDPDPSPPMSDRTHAKLVRQFGELVDVYATLGGLIPPRWHRRSRRRSS